MCIGDPSAPLDVANDAAMVVANLHALPMAGIVDISKRRSILTRPIMSAYGWISGRLL